MERLTKQNYTFDMLNIMQGMTKYAEIDTIMNCLAAYENTGLTPEEITKTFDDYRDTNLSQAQEFYDLEQERDTLKNALELACEVVTCQTANSEQPGMSSNRLMKYFVKQAQEGKDNAK